MPRVRRNTRKRTSIEQWHIQECLQPAADVPVKLYRKRYGLKHFTHGARRLDWKAIWRQIRDEWLPKFIEAHPGYRPWAWWEFDAPEPCRVVSGEVDPRNDASNPWHRLSFGVPTVWAVWRDEEYETETAFLDRLDLFAPGERKRVSEID